MNGSDAPLLLGILVTANWIIYVLYSIRDLLRERLPKPEPTPPLVEDVATEEATIGAKFAERWGKDVQP